MSGISDLERATLLALEEALPDEPPPPETVVEASFDLNQVRLTAKQDLNFLAGLAIPDVFKFMFPPILTAAWQILLEQEAKERFSPQIALGIPRGHAKTTLIKLWILYCILFTDRKFILVIAKTEDLAVNIVSDICDMLNEPNIQKVFGDWKGSLTINRQDLKKFGFRGRNITLAAIGAEGSLRGLNIRNERPDLMIFEDIQSREDAESATVSEKLKTWMVGTAMKAKSPFGCMFIFVGNMYPTQHSILRQLKENPVWIKFISGAILEDGTALWEELRPIDDLMREFRNDVLMGHPEIFFSEVLNDDTSGVNNRIDFTQLAEWKWTNLDRPQGKVIIVDPSANKTGGDAVAIGYMEVYDGVPAFRFLLEKKLSPGNIIKAALIMALETGTRLIVCESSGFQYSLLYWFEEYIKKTGITGIQCVDIYPGNMSKNARISDMMKSLMAGEIILHPSVRPAVSRQLADWKPLKRDNVDNLLDIIAYAPKVMAVYGPYLMVEEFQSVEAAMKSPGVVMDNLPF